MRSSLKPLLASLLLLPCALSAQGFVAGTPLPANANAKTFGSFLAAESVTHDVQNDRYIVVNTGVRNAAIPNDGYISLLNPDGSVHTLKWIAPTATNGVTLNDPRGSHLDKGTLYIADIDTVRLFDLATGAPKETHTIPGTLLLNDLTVAADGTIYVTESGNTEPATHKVYKIAPGAQPVVFASGPRIIRPNGIALDNDGNLVVLVLGSNEIFTFSPAGELLKTETSTDAGNDGIAILADGTKLISSVQQGKIARIRPGQPAEVIATGIPNAASMAYDAKRNQLVIPQNQQNAVTILQLR